MRTRAPLLLLPLLGMGLSGCLSEGGLSGVTQECPRQDLVLERTVFVTNLVGSGRASGPTSQSFSWALQDNLSAGADPTCFGALTVTITWTNGGSQGADLYVGIDVPPTGFSTVGTDEQQFIADGEHEESVLVPIGWEDVPHDALQEDLVLVIYSDWASLSASGLPVMVSLSLHPAA